MNKSTLFSSKSPHWRTPELVYQILDREFRFNLDPCPIGGNDGLRISWRGKRVYCNPPYGRAIASWFEKAYSAQLAVFLVPARTDTIWWHRFAPLATEIRFIRGRLHFNGHKTGAPFPSVIMVFRPGLWKTEWTCTDLGIRGKL